MIFKNFDERLNSHLNLLSCQKSDQGVFRAVLQQDLMACGTLLLLLGNWEDRLYMRHPGFQRIRAQGSEQGLDVELAVNSQQICKVWWLQILEPSQGGSLTRNSDGDWSKGQNFYCMLSDWNFNGVNRRAHNNKLPWSELYFGNKLFANAQYHLLRQCVLGGKSNSMSNISFIASGKQSSKSEKKSNKKKIKLNI